MLKIKKINDYIYLKSSKVRIDGEVYITSKELDFLTVKKLIELSIK